MALSFSGLRGVRGFGSAGPARRGRLRRVSLLDWAVGFALAGSVLAALVPSFVRQVHASRLVEPLRGVATLGAAAVAYAEGRSVVQAFPPTVGLTPPVPPRGRCEVDPPELWQKPTWTALDFRPAAPGVPHCFAFGFDADLAPTRSAFRAHAHGDLDGDGITSTFEVGGHVAEGEPRAVLDPGMYVDAEVE